MLSADISLPLRALCCLAPSSCNVVVVVVVVESLITKQYYCWTFVLSRITLLLVLLLLLQNFAAMDDTQKMQLANSIGLGAPGIVGDQDVDVFLAKIEAYGDVLHSELQDRLIEFLREVAPVAEECDVRIGFHPDDPPQPLFGLPRVISTAGDLRFILSEVDSDHVGITFCIGSYASNSANDTLKMAQEFAPYIHYCHLRNVVIEEDNKSFVEVGHLAGRNNVVEIVNALQSEEKRRQSEGRTDVEIPWRPDHGPLMFFEQDAANVDDIYPGYSLMGRYAGMSELRGVIAAVQAQY